MLFWFYSTYKNQVFQFNDYSLFFCIQFDFCEKNYMLFFTNIKNECLGHGSHIFPETVYMLICTDIICLE